MKALNTIILSTTLAFAIGCAKKSQQVDLNANQKPELSASDDANALKNAPQEVKDMIANFQRVHFDFDSHVLNDSSRDALIANVALMEKRKDIKVEIQGHADERGSTEYNLSLGQRRAESVKKYMTRAGVTDARIATISFGEEVPLVQATSETAYSQNRRAEFRVTWTESGDVGGTVK